MNGQDNTAATGGWTWAAWLAALAGVAGTLWLSLGQGLLACPLCYYQRTFVMGVFGVLSLGLVAGGRGLRVALLALPLAVGGLAVAGYHEYREVIKGDLECPPGIQVLELGLDVALGTAPQQSLALFVVLTLLLLVDARKAGLSRLAGALVLGALFAVACLATVAPRPIPETGELLGCRKPAGQ
jgi:disulfide bond formation protein DsbB